MCSGNDITTKEDGLITDGQLHKGDRRPAARRDMPTYLPTWVTIDVRACIISMREERV